MLCDYKISFIVDGGLAKEVKVRFYEGKRDKENTREISGKKEYIRERLLDEQVFFFEPWDSQKEIVAYLNKYLKDHYGQGRQPIDEQKETIPNS